MNRMQTLFALSLAACLPLLSACNDSGKTAWTSVAEDCAVSDLNGKKILFFGPSNVLGPGSIWRQPSAENGGGYRVRYKSDAIPNQSSWSSSGGDFACQGNRTTTLTGGATAGFASDLAPLSAETKADFERAKTAEIKVQKMRWDMLLEGPFENAILALPADNSVRQDLTKPGRYILYRALKVQGFEAKLSFDTKTGAELQSKYTGGALKSVNGEFGAGLSFKWLNESELVISAPNDFYIAGELVRFESGGGFANAGKSRFSPPVDVVPGSKLSVENPS